MACSVGNRARRSPRRRYRRDHRLTLQAALHLGGAGLVRADDAAAGSARTAVVATSGEVAVAVYSGDDPRRAMALRNAISLALASGELPQSRGRAAARGSVALVGGGPGDPELITVRGRRLVAEADLVVVDRLAPRALLAELAPSVEIIDCGKSSHRQNLSQDEINALLVERARAGKRVVRLKGGDPFVFGRGGEEWLACVSADFTVVSGHLDPGRSAERGIDWPGLAGTDATPVLLMAMDRLALIADELVAHGRAATTPAAVVHGATLPDQRVVRAPLGGLSAAVAQAGVGPPAVVVVGEVVDVLGSPNVSG